MSDEAPAAPAPEVPIGHTWQGFFILVITAIGFVIYLGGTQLFVGIDFLQVDFLEELLYGTILPWTAGLLLLVIGLFVGYLFLVARARQKYRERRSLNSVMLSVIVPKTNEILPDAAEAFFAGLYSIFKGRYLKDKLQRFFIGQEQISFEIVGEPTQISLCIYVPKSLENLVERQIYAQYPQAEVRRIPDYNIFSPGCEITVSELKKAKDGAYPIRTYRDFVKEEGTRELKSITVDPLSAITNAMTKVDKGEGCVVQILIRPIGAKWQKKGKKLIKKIHSKTKSTKEAAGEQLTSAEQENIKTLEQSIARPGFETVVRIVTASPIASRAEQLKTNILSAFAQFNTVEYNKLIIKRKYRKDRAFYNFIHRYFAIFNINRYTWDFPWFGRTSVLNSQELATLFHMPTKHIDTPYLAWVKAKKAPAPEDIPTELSPDGGVRVGFNEFRGVKKEVWMDRDDRRRHIYSIGKTGMGKSVLAENMVYQDIMNGEGVCYLDPHGDSIDHILEFIPRHRIDDVVLFDPADMEFPIGLNMLEFQTEDQKDFVVGEFVAILYKLFAEFIGPRFEHIVRNSLLAIMANPNGGTLVEMMRIITDESYKDECLQYVTNPLVKAFWLEEMAQQVDFHKSEMLGPVLSKFGRFVSNDMMRNIIGQTKSGFNVRDIMDKQKILLVKLSKGKIGDINCNLLGMIFVSKILMSALSRVDTPESERKDFYLYVDEFQNFASDSFSTILSEARKYRLNLYITHQYIGQLDDKVQKAVFGNTGTTMFMRVGAPDAELIAKELKPTFDESDVINVDKYTMYCKLLVNGVTSKPFSLHTYPPMHAKDNYAEYIVELCRRKFARPRKEVEEEIRQRAKLDNLDFL